jgi:hypothetical protein
MDGSEAIGVDGAGASSPAATTEMSIIAAVAIHRLNVNDLDRLIGIIFEVSSRSPLFFTSGLRPDVRAMIARDNPVADQILK